MTTGPDGRFRIEHLVPGVAYTVRILKPDEAQGTQYAYDFADHQETNVKPGEVQDWGDVRAKTTFPEAFGGTGDH